jgi:hypothetical protein
MAQNVQVQAGTLLSTFDIAQPAVPADRDIICATSGDFAISCVPEIQDFFEDVNNIPNNTKEGKEIIGWDCSLTVNCIEVTEDTLAMALGAATVTEGGSIKPRMAYADTDFKTLYWIGDMKDASKILVVKLYSAVNTSGISMTTAKNSKGQLALTLVPHFSLASPNTVPMSFYILTKTASASTGSTEEEE